MGLDQIAGLAHNNQAGDGVSFSCWLAKGERKARGLWQLQLDHEATRCRTELRKRVCGRGNGACFDPIAVSGEDHSMLQLRYGNTVAVPCTAGSFSEPMPLSMRFSASGRCSEKVHVGFEMMQSVDPSKGQLGYESRILRFRYAQNVRCRDHEQDGSSTRPSWLGVGLPVVRQAQSRLTTRKALI